MCSTVEIEIVFVGAISVKAITAAKIDTLKDKSHCERILILPEFYESFDNIKRRYTN
jgi:hypothetical protein